MQTREPRKRSNWLFVLLLIIVIPLALLVLFMMNSVPNETPTINKKAPANNSAPADSIKSLENNDLENN